MKSLLLSALLAPLLIGCATQVWYKEGSTPAEAHQALARAQRESRAATVNPLGEGLAWGIATLNQRADYIHDRMYGLGFEPVPRKTIPSGKRWPKE